MIILKSVFLRSLQHRAEWIYTVISSPSSKHHLTKRNVEKTIDSHWLLVYNNSDTAFDVKSYFGCNNHNSTHHSPTKLFMCLFEKPSAIGTPANINAKSNRENVPNIICDASMPAVTFDTDTYVDIVLKRSVFNHVAFWAFPIFDWMKNTTKNKEWSKLVQCILWRMGYQVTVFFDESNIDDSRDRNAKNSSVLGEEWSCSPEWSRQYEKYSISDEIMQFFKSDTLIVKEWLSALSASGYVFSEIAFNKTRKNCSVVTLQPVDYSAPIPFDSNNHRNMLPIANAEMTQKLFNRTCLSGRKMENDSKNLSIRVNFSQPSFQKSTILLVVTFNFPNYHSIPYVEAIYMSFFPLILYCGPDNNIENHIVLKDYRLSFITHRSHMGFFNYECAIKAMLLGFNVDGYFILSDDVLVNMKQISTNPLNAVWFLPEYDIFTASMETMKECRYGVCNVRPIYPHWAGLWNQVKQNIAEMKLLKQRSSFLHKCWETLDAVNLAANRINAANVDIYFIPEKLKKDFLEISLLFLNNNFYLEIAVTTAIRCLAKPEEYLKMFGTYVWHKHRDSPWNLFDHFRLTDQTFYHPTKWGLISQNSKQYSDLFCFKVIPFIFEPHSDFRKYTM